MLKCTRCQKKKTLEEMSVDKERKSGLSSWSKACRAYTAKKWANLNPEKAKENKKSPGYLKQREYMLRHRYGLSLEEYDLLLEQQEHSCAICKKHIDEMTYPLHVDHCHEKGHVRGLLCSACNLYVGYVKNNPSVFPNISFSYLKLPGVEAAIIQSKQLPFSENSSK